MNEDKNSKIQVVASLQVFLKECDSLYSVAVQGSCDIEAVAALHGSNSGLHDSRRTQH